MSDFSSQHIHQRPTFRPSPTAKDRDNREAVERGEQKGKTEAARLRRMEDRQDQARVSMLQRDERAQVEQQMLKADANRPVLESPTLPENMTVQELNELLTSASKKLLEGDPEAMEVALADISSNDQTFEQETQALFNKLNKNPYLQQQNVSVRNDGQVVVKDPTTGAPRNLSSDDRLLAQMFLAILMQELQNTRAESVSEKQKFLQNQAANNVIQQINKEVESQKDTKKSSDFSKASNIIGWIAAVATLVGGVLTANPGLIIAGVVAITVMSLQQGGVMDKATKALAKSLEDAGMSKRDAQIVASVIIAVAIVVVSIAAGAGGGSSSTLKDLATKAKDILKLTQKMMTVTTKVMQVSMMAATTAEGAMGTASGVYQGKASQKQAESTKFEAVVQDLQYNIDELIKALKEVVEKAGVIKAFSKQMQDQFSTQSGIYQRMA